jgi:SAM-dependent methyltransferase
MSDITTLLASYPRTRQALPAANARIYAREYKINRGASSHLLYSITAWLESWMHRMVASEPSGQRVLELGAGTLNHRRYESKDLVYDIVEPFSALYRGSPELASVNHVYASIHEIPLEPGYDRIFSVAVLEHLEDLPAIVAASAGRLSQGGVFQAGIPAEGGLTWGLAWRCSTGLSYRLRTGLPYAPVMRHEHINSADEIIAIVRHFFHDVRLRWFPLPAKHFAFYGFIEARNPKRARGDA